MKHLDWKSFAIGILLTTTVVFGVAATNPSQQKLWDKKQKWMVTKVSWADMRTNIKTSGGLDAVWEGMEPMNADQQHVFFKAPYKDFKTWREEFEGKFKAAKQAIESSQKKTE